VCSPSSRIVGNVIGNVSGHLQHITFFSKDQYHCAKKRLSPASFCISILPDLSSLGNGSQSWCPPPGYCPPGFFHDGEALRVLQWKGPVLCLLFPWNGSCPPGKIFQKFSPAPPERCRCRYLPPPAPDLPDPSSGSVLRCRPFYCT